MEKKRILMLIGSVCLALMLALPLVGACAAPTPTPTPTPTPPPELVEPRVLKVSSHYQPSHLEIQAGELWAARVTERTQGLLDFKWYTAGSLVSGREALAAIRDGVVEMGTLAASYFKGEFPFTCAISSLPFTVTESNVRKAVPLATRTYIFDEANAQNMRPLFNISCASQPLFSSLEIDPANPSFKGVKVRTATWGIRRMIELLGGVGVAMSSSEVPVALGTGVVDAFFTGLPTYVSLDIVNEAPYIYRHEAIYVMGTHYEMNLDVWNSLSKEFQDILLEEGQNACDWYWDKYHAEHATVLENLTAKGAKIHLLTPEEKEIWRGLVAKTIHDEFVAEYGEKAERWLALLAEL